MSASSRVLLRRALAAASGEERLRRLLGVSEARFAGWMQGVRPLPTALFLEIVDLLSTRAAEVERATQEVRIESKRLMADARNLPAEAASVIRSSVALRAQRQR